MPCKTSTVVLDTNAVLDCRLFGDPRAAALSDALARRRVRWLATKPMQEELAEVLRRPIAPRWDAGRERLLLDFDRLDADIVEEPPKGAHRLVCSDPDDQKFLDLALAHRACWLVTRDRALLALRKPAAAQGLAILQPAAWPGEEPGLNGPG